MITLNTNTSAISNSNIFTIGNTFFSVANGNIGFGNTTPAYKVHVEGVVYSSGFKTSNAAAAGADDVSKHVDLYGGIYGLSITNTRLNYVVPTGANHFIRVGGNDIVIANSSGAHPGSSGTLDLGSISARWRNIYTSDLNLSNGIGDYTIVEGEDDLFLYNNKKGKVYKFALIEVDPSTAVKK